MQNYALIVHTLPDFPQLPNLTVTEPMYRVGVLGASGYAGRELCALILGHPHLTLAFATANAQRGTTLRVKAGGQVHAIPMVGPDEVDLSSADLVFAALPHGASAEWVAKVLAAGARVVDLSSDLRPGHGGTDHAPTGGRTMRRMDCRSCFVPRCMARAWWPIPAATPRAFWWRWRRWRRRG